jgi:hypothetical protein
MLAATAGATGLPEAQAMSRAPRSALIDPGEAPWGNFASRRGPQRSVELSLFLRGEALAGGDAVHVLEATDHFPVGASCRCPHFWQTTIAVERSPAVGLGALTGFQRSVCVCTVWHFSHLKVMLTLSTVPPSYQAGAVPAPGVSRRPGPFY